MKRRRVPKRVWVVVDLDAEICPLWEVFPTKREAREKCDALNSVRGYEPTCTVVAYQHKGEGEP